jgi:hypothetical protein
MKYKYLQNKMAQIRHSSNGFKNYLISQLLLYTPWQQCALKYNIVPRYLCTPEY